MSAFLPIIFSPARARCHSEKEETQTERGCRTLRPADHLGDERGHLRHTLVPHDVSGGVQHQVQWQESFVRVPEQLDADLGTVGVPRVRTFVAIEVESTEQFREHHIEDGHGGDKLLLRSRAALHQVGQRATFAHNWEPHSVVLL